jgi:hypothetical protein
LYKDWDKKWKDEQGTICDYAIAMALYLEREKQMEELEDGSLSSLQG